MFEANQDVYNTRLQLPYYRLAVELKLVLMKSLQPDNVCKLTNLAYKAFKMLGLSQLLKRLRFTAWQLDDARSKQPRIFAKRKTETAWSRSISCQTEHYPLSNGIVICVIQLLI